MQTLQGQGMGFWTKPRFSWKPCNWVFCNLVCPYPFCEAGCNLMRNLAAFHSEELGGTWAENATSWLGLRASSCRPSCAGAGQRVRLWMLCLSPRRSREQSPCLLWSLVPSAWGLGRVRGIWFLTPLRRVLQDARQWDLRGWLQVQARPAPLEQLTPAACREGSIVRTKPISFFQSACLNWDT